jgi:hypothetical protein
MLLLWMCCLFLLGVLPCLLLDNAVTLLLLLLLLVRLRLLPLLL